MGYHLNVLKMQAKVTTIFRKNCLCHCTNQQNVLTYPSITNYKFASIQICTLCT